MSTHAAHRGIATANPRRKGWTALTISAAGIWLALAATATATAADQTEPANRPEITASVPNQGPPNYPNYGRTTAPMPNPGPPNYPNYDPRYEVPRAESVVQQSKGLDTNSVALGALGGIALACAGLGITLGVQRRRDHAAPHAA